MGKALGVRTSVAADELLEELTNYLENAKVNMAKAWGPNED